MRLWHYKLIPVLPRQQLLGQWRECCLIAKELAKNGTPNHILVNPVMDYPLSHFCYYSNLIASELQKRGYSIDWSKFSKWLKDKEVAAETPYAIKRSLLFAGWHTDEYLKQCYYNLEEKHDRGGITDADWEKIVRFYQ